MTVVRTPRTVPKKCNDKERTVPKCNILLGAPDLQRRLMQPD